MIIIDLSVEKFQLIIKGHAQPEETEDYFQVCAGASMLAQGLAHSIAKFQKQQDGIKRILYRGDPGDMVLKNLDYLKLVGKLYEVRTVILPGRDEENEKTVQYVAEKIGGSCFYKIIRYRPFGVRERFQKVLGEEEADEEYAERYARLARELGASKAYVV